MSWRAVERSPFRGWAAWEPRARPAAPAPTLDLAAGRLAWPARAEATLLPTEAPPAPDVVLLPPVPPEAARTRDDLAGALERSGCVVLAQRGADEAPAARGVDLLDLTAVLLAARALTPGGLAAVGRRWVLLPLLPGVVEGEALERLLDDVAALAPEAVLPVTPELAPADRRRIVAALGEGRFEAIFHGPAPSEAAVARALAARGLSPLPSLPEPAGLAARAARDRRLAASLAEAGELALKLGRSEAIGEGLLAASRRLASEPRDVSALAREGNLGLLGWLSPAAQSLIVEETAGRGSALLRELRAAWTGADG